MRSIPELSTRKVGQNNILAASDRNSNPYLQHKLFHSTPKSNDADKLFSFQSRIFNGNSYALDLLVQKFDGVERGTSKVLLHHGSCSTSPDINNLSVFNVAAHCRGETGKTSLKKALPLLQQRPNDIGLVLTLVQIYVGMNNVSSAISLVESLFERLEKSRANSDLDVRFNPGLVSVLVSLYESEGRKKAVMAELKKAATHWLERADQAPSLLRVAGISLLHSSNPSDLKKAGEIFSKLHELDTSDPIAAAGYVASYATMAPPTAIRSEAHRLSQVKDLVTDIDIAALEQAGVPALTSAGTLAALRTSRKRGAAGAAPEFRKKRIRKSRLPKDYDPNKQPDPERWLPMRDRSTYRPAKGKKGKQRAQDRTQGGIVTESGAEAGGPQPAQTTVSTSKKKKGKGKR
jgi:signal recognition particle subunit SRP72